MNIFSTALSIALLSLQIPTAMAKTVAIPVQESNQVKELLANSGTRFKDRLIDQTHYIYIDTGEKFALHKQTLFETPKWKESPALVAAVYLYNTRGAKFIFDGAEHFGSPTRETLKSLALEMDAFAKNLEMKFGRRISQNGVLPDEFNDGQCKLFFENMQVLRRFADFRSDNSVIRATRTLVSILRSPEESDFFEALGLAGIEFTLESVPNLPEMGDRHIIVRGKSLSYFYKRQMGDFSKNGIINSLYVLSELKNLPQKFEKVASSFPEGSTFRMGAMTQKAYAEKIILEALYSLMPNILGMNPSSASHMEPHGGVLFQQILANLYRNSSGFEGMSRDAIELFVNLTADHLKGNGDEILDIYWNKLEPQDKDQIVSHMLASGMNLDVRQNERPRLWPNWSRSKDAHQVQLRYLGNSLNKLQTIHSIAIGSRAKKYLSVMIEYIRFRSHLYQTGIKLPSLYEFGDMPALEENESRPSSGTVTPSAVLDSSVGWEPETGAISPYVGSPMAFEDLTNQPLIPSPKGDGTVNDFMSAFFDDEIF